MPEIQVPELARKLARRMGVTGGNVAPSLAPEVVPIVTVADLTVPYEMDVGEMRYCQGQVSQAAVAGEAPNCQLFNRSGSGVVGEVDGAIVSSPTAGTIVVRVYDAGLGTAGSVGFRDRRLAGSPGCEVNSNTSVGATGSPTLATWEIPANEPIIVPLDWILPPTKGLLVSHLTVNTKLSATFFWTERTELESP